MSAAKRRRDNLRQRACEPFAAIHCDDLLSAACVLTPVALRLWLLLHAAWVPPPRGSAKPGETFLAFSQAVDMAGHGRSAIAAAFRELEERRLIVLVREGSRPLASGAAVLGRQAAVWDLPSRHPRRPGEHPKPPLPSGVERPQGKVRWNAHRIRMDIKDLSPIATKVLAFALAHRDRDKWGGLPDNAPFPLPARPLSQALGASASAAADAVRELAEKGRLVRAKPQSGRRAATCMLRGHYTKQEKHGGKMPAEPTAMVTTSGLDDGRKSRTSGTASVPLADARL